MLGIISNLVNVSFVSGDNSGFDSFLNITIQSFVTRFIKLFSFICCHNMPELERFSFTLDCMLLCDLKHFVWNGYLQC